MWPAERRKTAIFADFRRFWPKDTKITPKQARNRHQTLILHRKRYYRGNSWDLLNLPTPPSTHSVARLHAELGIFFGHYHSNQRGYIVLERPRLGTPRPTGRCYFNCMCGCLVDYRRRAVIKPVAAVIHFKLWIQGIVFLCVFHSFFSVLSLLFLGKFSSLSFTCTSIPRPFNNRPAITVICLQWSFISQPKNKKIMPLNISLSNYENIRCHIS